MKEELIKLKKYHLSTTQNGIIMPTKDEFDTKVKMLFLYGHKLTMKVEEIIY